MSLTATATRFLLEADMKEDFIIAPFQILYAGFYYLTLSWNFEVVAGSPVGILVCPVLWPYKATIYLPQDAIDHTADTNELYGSWKKDSIS